MVVLEKTLESPLDCKEIKPIHPKGDQSWIFIGRSDAKAEAPILWPPHAKNWLTGKDPDAGKDRRQEEKGTTEGEMVGWHYWLNGHEFEQALGAGDGQRNLACCSPCSLKELDTTERLNSTEGQVRGVPRTELRRRPRNLPPGEICLISDSLITCLFSVTLKHPTVSPLSNLPGWFMFPKTLLLTDLKSHCALPLRISPSLSSPRQTLWFLSLNFTKLIFSETWYLLPVSTSLIIYNHII